MSSKVEQEFKIFSNCLPQTKVMESPTYYPNCDTSIWLRTAKDEIKKPVEGKVTYGRVPNWLNGKLIRNGPGGPDAYGKGTCKHLFDGPGLLHKFDISNEKVFYTNRYIRTRAYTRNITSRRLILSEFGTFATPDPCRRIFSRVQALFNCQLEKLVTDTANISIHPFGDEIYTLAETPFAHRIDLDTLKTMSTINVHDQFGIINHTSHPHIESSRQKVYNLGQKLSPWYGPHYIIAEMSAEAQQSPADLSKSPWSTAREILKIPSRWPLSLCYMHSFSLTPKYFILVEQPMCISLLSIPYNLVWGEKPISASLQFFPEEDTIFHVVGRDERKEFRRKFRCPAFFFLHTINAFERWENGKEFLYVDICTYKDPKMIECLYVDALKNAQSNPDYATMFRSKPKRFRMEMTRESESTGGSIPPPPFIPPAESEIIVDLGCETPQINYDTYNGKPYTYFYAISADVDSANPGTLIKVNTVAKTVQTWSIPMGYPSEPIFYPTPCSKDEDDGIIMSAILYGGEMEGPNSLSLVILGAKKLELLAKVDFQTNSVIPKCLHGWFFPEKKPGIRSSSSEEGVPIPAANFDKTT